MTGWEFRKGPWQNVEWLAAETQKFYDEKVTPNGRGDRFTNAVERIVKRRGWKPSLTLIEDNLEPVVRELGIFFVPRQIDPGPAIVFPQKDLTNRYTHGKMKPYWELELMGNIVKYANLGNIQDIKGPNLFGNTDRALLAMARTRKAIFVEGFYDLLACRVLLPDAPVISTGTKSLTEAHIYYLQVLGVTETGLMFDNEPPKDESRREGAGNQAMRFLGSKLADATGMSFTSVLTPADDASRCLEHTDTAIALKNVINAFIAPL